MNRLSGLTLTGIILGAARGLAIAISGVAMFVALRKLSVGEYGTLVTHITTAAIISQVAVSGVTAAATIGASYRSQELIKKVQRVFFILLTMGAGLLLPLSAPLHLQLALVVGLFIAGSLGNYGNALLTAHHHRVGLFIGEISQPLVQCIGWIVLWQTSTLTVERALIVVILAMVIRALVQQFAIVKLPRELENTAPPKNNLPELRTLIWRTSMVNIATLLVLRSDVILLRLLSNSSEQGYYAAASQLAELLLTPAALVAGLATKPLVERIQQGNPVSHTDLIRKGGLYGISSTLLLGGIMIMSIKLILPSYTNSIPSLLYLLPGLCALAWQIIPSQALAVHSYPKHLVTSWVSGLVLNIVLNCLLIPSLGGIGAALASSFAYSLVALLILTHRHDYH